jgi:hypothetical protein
VQAIQVRGTPAVAALSKHKRELRLIGAHEHRPYRQLISPERGFAPQSTPISGEKASVISQLTFDTSKLSLETVNFAAPYSAATALYSLMSLSSSLIPDRVGRDARLEDPMAFDPYWRVRAKEIGATCEKAKRPPKISNLLLLVDSQTSDRPPRHSVTVVPIPRLLRIPLRLFSNQQAARFNFAVDFSNRSACGGLQEVARTEVRSRLVYIS